MTADLFEPVSERSGKIRCRVCGAQGWPMEGFLGSRAVRHWTQRHVDGHAPCDRCGKQLPLTKGGKARGHSRCPERSA